MMKPNEIKILAINKKRKDQKLTPSNFGEKKKGGGPEKREVNQFKK